MEWRIRRRFSFTSLDALDLLHAGTEPGVRSCQTSRRGGRKAPNDDLRVLVIRSHHIVARAGRFGDVQMAERSLHVRVARSSS